MLPERSVTMSSPLRLIGELPLPGEAIGAIAAGADGRAYVARADRVEVIDLGDPTRPRRRGGVALDGAGNLAVDGERLAVAAEGAVALLDVREPDAPLRRGGFALPDAVDVAVDGEVVLATDGAALAAWRVDWARGQARPGPRCPIELAGRITLAGGRAYVAADCEGLIVVERTGDRLVRAGAFVGPGDVCKAAVDGALAYVADYSGGLSVVDVASPRRPRSLAEWDQGLVGDVAVHGGRAFAAMGGLAVLDVSAPGQLRALGMVTRPGGGDTAWRIAVVGSHLLALGEHGLTVWA